MQLACHIGSCGCCEARSVYCWVVGWDGLSGAGLCCWMSMARPNSRQGLSKTTECCSSRDSMHACGIQASEGRHCCVPGWLSVVTVINVKGRGRTLARLPAPSPGSPAATSGVNNATHTTAACNPAQETQHAPLMPQQLAAHCCCCRPSSSAILIGRLTALV